jgi:hypothetical protein
MTAALMGANIALGGTIDATPEEAVALARDSGVPDIPPDGYTTDHMLTALRKRYGLDLFAANVPIEGWRTRLGKRGAAIIAVHYPDLPAELQALAPGFTKGHRMLVVGYDPKKDTTHLLDPLRRTGRDRGTEIDLRTIYAAQGSFVWSQVWLREGQGVDVIRDLKMTWDEPRRLRLKGDGQRAYRFWDRHRPGRPIEKQPPRDLDVEFDAQATFSTRPRGLLPVDATMLRIVGGDRESLVGTWLEVTPDVHPDLSPDGPVPAADGGGFAAGYRTGRDDERARWLDWLAAAPDRAELPFAPHGDEPSIGMGLKAVGDPD